MFVKSSFLEKQELLNQVLGLNFFLGIAAKVTTSEVKIAMKIATYIGRSEVDLWDRDGERVCVEGLGIVRGVRVGETEGVCVRDGVSVVVEG